MPLQKMVALVTVMSMHMWFNAVSGNVIPVQPPQFTDPPQWPDRNYYDEDGPPITLTCRVRQDIGVTLLWYRNSLLLSSIPETLIISNHNQTVTLEIPSTDQSGNYTCQAYNDAGNISHSGNVLITARRQETRPRVTMTIPTSTTMYAAVGEPVNISCVFDVGGSSMSLLDLSLDWMKDKMDVNDTFHSTWGINTTRDNNQVFSLKIDKLKENDYGMYECIGINSMGNDSKLILVAPPEPDKKKLPLTFIIGGSVVGVVVMAAVIVVTITVRYKIKMRNNYEELEWEEPDISKYGVPSQTVEYDVFISYSSDDLAWVKDTLFQQLCDQKYQVCIDFKDFTPGLPMSLDKLTFCMAVSENIIDAIYKSKKTIVLMSQNFLKSMWGQFELQQAHNRAIMQRQDVLVLIKYDDCKVPAKLMGKTFLDWTDPSVQPHFWTRLFEALGDPCVLNSPCALTQESTDISSDTHEHSTNNMSEGTIVDTVQTSCRIENGHVDSPMRSTSTSNNIAPIREQNKEVHKLSNDVSEDSENSINDEIEIDNETSAGNHMIDCNQIAQKDDTHVYDSEANIVMSTNLNNVKNVEAMVPYENNARCKSSGCSNFYKMNDELPEDMDSGIHEEEFNENEFNLDIERMINTTT